MASCSMVGLVHARRWEKGIKLFLIDENLYRYLYKLSINKCCGLTHKKNNWQHMELSKSGFKTGEWLTWYSVINLNT